MMKNLVTIGDKLELKKLRVSSKDTEDQKVYKSQVLDIKEDDTAVILMPIDKGRIVPLNVDDKYNMRFYTKKGLYQCKAVITERSRINNIFVLTVQCISELEKFQRRQFYRLECLLDIEYYVVSDIEISITNKLKSNNNYKDEAEKQHYQTALDSCNKEWKQGIILDISGGGARFISSQFHDYGELIKLSVHFLNQSDNKKYLINAVIESSEKMNNRPGYYEHRIQFKDIQKEEREAIIKFIFEEERRQRSKGKK